MKFILFLLVVLNVSCGQDMSSVASLEPTKECATCLNPEPPGENLAPSIPEEELSGKISSSLFKNAQAFFIDVPNKEVILMLPIPIPFLIQIPDQPIHELPGAYYRLAPSQNGLSQVEVHVPFAYFAPNTSGQIADRLPNGDRLPAVPNGEYPAYAVKVESSRDFYLYLGPSLAAIYLPTPEFNPFLALNFPIQNKSKTKTLGYVALIPEKRGFDGGFFLSVQLPKELARFLDSILP